jgi:hypothetical protein
LAHIDRRIGSGAQHYLGWTQNLATREKAHRSGRGTPLLREAKRLGVGWEIIRTWNEKTRGDERKMKNGGSLSRFCPSYRAAYLQMRNRQQKIRRARDGRADRPRKNPRGPLA